MTYPETNRHYVLTAKSFRMAESKIGKPGSVLAGLKPVVRNIKNKKTDIRKFLTKFGKLLKSILIE